QRFRADPARLELRAIERDPLSGKIIAPSRFCQLSLLTPCTSNLFRDTKEEAAARPELRCEYADATSAPDLIDVVEQVDDVETYCHRLRIVRQQEFALDADIDLR